MTIQKNITNALCSILVGLVAFYASINIFRAAAGELHLIISVTAYLISYLLLDASDNKNEILKAIKEGECKHE